MKKYLSFFLKLVVSLFVLAISGLLITIPVYYLWNWLMPELFGLTKITFLQAYGLILLCSFLFKSNNNNNKE